MFQLKKRDLRNILGIDALRAALQTPRCAHVESVAPFRHGVHRALATVLAALLVDHVLPAVGYRQWVLSFQGPLAVRLGYDTDLLAAVCEKLARALMQEALARAASVGAPRLRWRGSVLAAGELRFAGPRPRNPRPPQRRWHPAHARQRAERDCCGTRASRRPWPAGWSRNGDNGLMTGLFL